MQGLKFPKVFQRNLLSRLFVNTLKMIITNGSQIILNHFLIIIIQIGSGLKKELTIIQNDARKIPVTDNSVDFVFIDSPYSDNVKYSDHPDCIGKISCEKEKFFEELEKVAKEIYRILKPDKYMAWLIGDHWRKNTGYIPVGFKVYNMLNNFFNPVDVICVIRRNQTSNTGLWHRRAREFNFYLRGFKYLFVMQKPEQEES
jgi:hypothetical protein